MIFVSMVIDTEPANRDALAEAMAIMMVKTRGEEGCVAYIYSQDLIEPNRFHLCEMWLSESLMDAHIDAEHAAEFVQALNAYGRIVSVKAFGGAVDKFRIRAPAPRA